MRILLTSSSYPSGPTDWQGVFIRHMVEGLSAIQELHVELWAPPGDRPAAVGYACTALEAEWLHHLSEKGGIAHILKSSGISRVLSPLRLILLQRRAFRRYPHFDLFHVNWLQNSLALYGISKPLLVTVLGTDMGLLGIPGMIPLLRGVFKSRRTVIAPNAQWMVDRLKACFGDIARITPVPFGINDIWYQIQREETIQRPCEWIVVSRVTKEKMGTLFEWGKPVFESKRQLHLFGPMQEEVTIPEWINYHGPTHPAELNETWFRRAAGLITLSRHAEGRPQVILEAMASSLPVIVSNIKAHTNLIHDRETGMVVDSAQALTEAVDYLETPSINRSIGLKARQYVRTHMGTWHDCANRFAIEYNYLTQ